MPAHVRQAMFQPIPPDLDLKKLIEETDNFHYVARINCGEIEKQGAAMFEKLVTLHTVISGRPLVLDGLQDRLPSHIFGPSWLDLNHGQDLIKVRDLQRQENVEITTGHYLKHMPKLTNQYTSENYKDGKRQRLYAKDIDCPDAWFKYLQDLLPGGLFYFNDSTGQVGGPGAIEEQTGPYGQQTMGKGIASSGDLMSSLPANMRAENMMCYIGHEGTYTPAHREMCASVGHNIMVEASGDGLDPWGKQEKAGSSIWFMTESKDRKLVSEYWLSILGHDIEVEDHFAQINAWINAPFPVYIVEQKVGDFILIPPLAPHQVWNRGTRTMKAAWNRTTVETLEMAFEEALPRARMVCRDEQYKNKAIVYFTLYKYSKLLDRAEEQNNASWGAPRASAIYRSKKVRQLQLDFRRLFRMWTKIMLSEMFYPDPSKDGKGVQHLPFESNVTCAYCRCNIFNRFLTCTSCAVEDEDGETDQYDVCMECYAMGRSCGCISKLKWVEQFKWRDLVHQYDSWRMQVIDIEGGVSETSPQPLDEARKRLNKKTLAQICQEQLRVRPWCDITKPLAEQTDPKLDDQDDDEEVEVDEDGRKKKKRRKSKKTEKWCRENSVCHICKERQPNWKMASCDCGFHYCYGVLYRAFDRMPQDIMERPDWKCPRCTKICSCAACSKDGDSMPYEPAGTLVGHDTKRVADPRSVDALVDYSRSNLYWINKQTPANGQNRYDSIRLQRRREEAEREKAREDTLNESYVDDGEDDDEENEYGDDYVMSQENGIHQDGYTMSHEGFDSSQQEGGLRPVALPLDPRLGIETHNSNATFWQDTSPQAPGQPGRVSLPSPSAMMNGASATYSHPHGNHSINSFHGSNSASATQRPVSNHRSDANMTDANDAPYESDESHGPPAGFVAPRSTVLNHEEQDEDDSYHSSGQRGGMHDANRQFHKAQLQRTLAEAKKNNVYNITQARLRGQQKVVKFAVPRSHLAGLPQDNAEGRTNPRALGISDAGVAADDDSELPLVVSDIPRSRPGTMQYEGANDEDDLDEWKQNTHGRGRGGRQSKGSGRAGRKSKSNADLDESDDDNEENAQVEAEQLGSATKKRRESAWLARKNQDEPSDMPTELPNRPPRRRRPSQKDTQPPAEEETSDVEVDDSYQPLPAPAAAKNGHSYGQTTSPRASDRAASAQASNRDAKMLALRFAEGEVSDLDDEDSASFWEEEPAVLSSKAAKVTKIPRGAVRMPSHVDAQPTNNVQPGKGNRVTSNGDASAPTSIFARPEMQGRKIKIVSAKNAGKPSTNSPASASKAPKARVSSGGAKGKGKSKSQLRRLASGDEEDGLF
ncbi:MAG: hypothetical protein M4579_004580 [Chaenotheca gracillima]|nr:MAG: hypothetical protein M4579_004580 [Chaenotheca gracillima]